MSTYFSVFSIKTTLHFNYRRPHSQYMLYPLAIETNWSDASILSEHCLTKKMKLTFFTLLYIAIGSQMVCKRGRIELYFRSDAVTTSINWWTQFPLQVQLRITLMLIGSRNCNASSKFLIRSRVWSSIKIKIRHWWWYHERKCGNCLSLCILRFIQETNVQSFFLK